MADIKSWTGERLETFVYNENTNEHLHRYALAIQLVSGKDILDIACGEGYGSNLMAASARSVAGVDIDEQTIVRAKEKYKKENLSFLAGSVVHIPYPDANFDVVISFETIEHHDEHEKMMQEIKRVLRPGGILFISSPDKLYYSDKTGFKNTYHVKELYRTEFEGLLKKHFTNNQFFGQRSFFGSIIAPFAGSAGADALTVFKSDYTAVDSSGMNAVYVVALASDGPLPPFNDSLLDGAEVLRRQFEDYRIEVTKDAVGNITREIRSSWSFRIGHFILSPMRIVKKIFHA